MTPTPTPKSTWKDGPHISGPENRRLQKFHVEAQPSCSRNKGGRHASERLNTSGVIVCNCRNASRKRLIFPTTHIAQQLQAEWIPPRPSRHEHPTSFRKSFSKTRRAPAWCDRPQRLRKHAGLLTKFFFLQSTFKVIRSKSLSMADQHSEIGAGSLFVSWSGHSHKEASGGFGRLS